MKIKEIAIVSGKGGTGKTSLVASIIPYFESVTLADCDVDAPDLNILFKTKILTQKGFIGIQKPVLDESKCIDCKLCFESCKFGAITEDITFNLPKCEGCSVCEYVCPNDAITLVDYMIGDIFTRDTKFGKIVDARLNPGEETSGKLVSEVRREAKRVAEAQQSEYIIIDGSPGIACNVVSTVTGVNKVVIVTEPSMSGLHDLEKVHKLIATFSLKPILVINKYDLSIEMTKKLEDYAKDNNIPIILKIPFDKSIVDSIANLEIPSIEGKGFYATKEWGNFIKYLKQEKM